MKIRTRFPSCLTTLPAPSNPNPLNLLRLPHPTGANDTANNREPNAFPPPDILNSGAIPPTSARPCGLRRARRCARLRLRSGQSRHCPNPCLQSLPRGRKGSRQPTVFPIERQRSHQAQSLAGPAAGIAFDGANPLARMSARRAREPCGPRRSQKGRELWGDGWAVALNGDIAAPAVP